MKWCKMVSMTFHDEYPISELSIPKKLHVQTYIDPKSSTPGRAFNSAVPHVPPVVFGGLALPKLPDQAAGGALKSLLQPETASSTAPDPIITQGM